METAQAETGRAGGQEAARPLPVGSPRPLLEQAFDRLYAPRRRVQFRQGIVYLALAGLGVHAALVFLARELADPPAVVAAVGTTYLSALYTPFSFVLFYEVLLLILAIPESMTRSLGKQYEILSLIVIRNVFKDIAEFESATDLAEQLEEFGAVLLDMAGGLLMFLLVAIFYHVNSRRPKGEDTGAEAKRRIETFVGRKKVIALALSALLFGLAAFNLGSWLLDVLSVARFGALPTVDIRTIFYLDLFTVLVFADALILVLSLLHSSRYELVFRNAAFVVSTILLRFCLALDKPYDVGLGVLTIAFGVAVVLIYNHFLRVQLREAPASARRLPPA